MEPSRKSSSPDASLPDFADQPERVLSASEIEAALATYSPECRFVSAARVSADGRHVRASLAIPAPYYIDDTGHFNSVEFNLCAEQLLALACFARSPAHPPTSSPGVAAAGHAGPEFTIVELSSRFPSPMNATQFTGELRCTSGTRSAAIAADVSFWNAAGGPSHGALVATAPR